MLSLPVGLHAQDWFKTETSSGVSNIRLAVADFKGVSATDPQTLPLKHTFDTTLYNDLSNAGIFDLISKSMLPQASPGAPAEINLAQWGGAPASAAMVAFGAFGSSGGRITVNGFLFDAKNTQFPQVLAKQYNEQASDDMARQVAHRFADEIIFRLGGGVPGIAETKIYYVKIGGGNKEIWAMDYDGANQHAITHLGTVSISPRISPDNSRIAFSSLGRDGFQIRMYSLLLNRPVSFPSAGGTNLSPAWSPNGRDIAFSSSRSGDPEIWIADSNGGSVHRVTSFRGPDVSPVFNPKTGSQIAWISGRTGLPQLYIMDTDGSGVSRMTDGGYATSPSWSPNGQFIAFAWDRKYGPGAPGGQDIYVMEVATKRWIQLTHDIGRCDFPSWSPDGRHIVFANTPGGRSSSTRIVSMLADGTGRKTLTEAGADMPNWSWK
ncbi:MAG: Tol-Pal system beta propeller repeat protein TolB [Edaphobacter sp.]|uniref:Tol-Pal system beta propeller repeat protein TolB n=1 Tax=Edaphobacter sp. TaxID=1934404 RepID=UPI0023948957|nr:Tol-Pal system beta propeller repeat protein TolB [Edaphobacter sp.]MDE1175387.1 Tol-Pal system beta propeller repeat protein TolB [Edaphobacter sp.]